MKVCTKEYQEYEYLFEDYYKIEFITHSFNYNIVFEKLICERNFFLVKSSKFSVIFY